MDAHVNLFFWILPALGFNTCPFDRYDFLSQTEAILCVHNLLSSFTTENGPLTIPQIPFLEVELFWRKDFFF